jgi:hypothetical protein
MASVVVAPRLAGARSRCGRAGTNGARNPTPILDLVSKYTPAGDHLCCEALIAPRRRQHTKIISPSRPEDHPRQTEVH